MKTKLLKVVSQSCPVVTKTLNGDGQQTTKCFIRLKELGGGHADEYLCLMSGPAAERRFMPGTLVAASITLGIREKNGKWYQAAWLNEITEISKVY